jgi:broad specificity phosphatase PhoE
VRPLDRKGRRQAEKLVDLLAPFGVQRIMTSPYLRCVQTVAPLAAELGIAMAYHEGLAEGAGAGDIGRALAAARDATTVLCTHGDVMIALVGDGRPIRKGSTWVLEVERGALVPVRYLEPPG